MGTRSVFSFSPCVRRKLNDLSSASTRPFASLLRGASPEGSHSLIADLNRRVLRTRSRAFFLLVCSWWPVTLRRYPFLTQHLRRPCAGARVCFSSDLFLNFYDFCSAFRVGFFGGSESSLFPFVRIEITIRGSSPRPFCTCPFVFHWEPNLSPHFFCPCITSPFPLPQHQFFFPETSSSSLIIAPCESARRRFTFLLELLLPPKVPADDFR